MSLRAAAEFLLAVAIIIAVVATWLAIVDGSILTR